MLYIIPGLFACYVQNLSALPHQHHLLQANLTHAPCTTIIDNKQYLGSCLINSNIKHQLDMQAGWIVLIEPSSQLGESLQTKLGSSPVHPLQLTSELGVNATITELQAQFDAQQTITHQIDARINTVVKQLDTCLDGNTCLKPARFSAKQVAESLHLSESRFLHLFKAQMHIAWRPYVLWRRLICAVKMLQQGHNLTHAAIAAGFADSAHLSRTFKRQFGLTPTDSIKSQVS
ncbi:helix-turn-helix domain-containing protein [Pseudoalteromonas sp. T1lg65]|uniref:helix-turn-helix domain-containing protein n=1 Tax=Pseudoalteromonas sp. T1lg65 TaxID=2077101 RepID=UPI003F7937A3